MTGDSPQRARAVVIVAAVALVLLRSIVFLCYEQNFDSDQAIVDLMAKHASEFRTFPLFFYGQHYMLGVQAWLAVPFFWVGGPTVTMLRAPLLLTNIAVVVLLIGLLTTAVGLTPGFALLAVLPIAACGPVASAQLLTVLGASIEPLFYVIGLWTLRNRPVPFGVLLCLGALHREFTLFALPAVAFLQWLDVREIRWSAMAKAAAAFGLMWLAVDQLKRHVLDVAGPLAVSGDGGNGSLALEAVQVGRVLSFHPDTYFARLRLLLGQGLPDLFGARTLPLFTGGIWGDGNVGSWLAGATFVAALLLCVMRLPSKIRRTDLRALEFPAFLLLVALQALVAYGLHGGRQVEMRTELNYVLMALFLPVAVFAGYFRVESSRGTRRVASALIAVWALFMLFDTLRVTGQYAVSPPASPHRVLADYLVAHRVKYAEAGYWDSYRVTFLSRERVIVGSADIVRIPWYQTRVELNRLNAARIDRLPCDWGARVAEWCVSDPLDR